MIERQSPWQTPLPETVDPPLWRKLVLAAPKTDGSLARVELLRPRWWLDEQLAFVGGVVDIHVPECGISPRCARVSRPRTLT